MSQYGGVVSGGDSHRSSSTKHSNHKKDKSKHMYMERRKGSSKASIVYDPNYRPGHKSSGSSRHHSSHRGSIDGSAAATPPTYAMPSYQPSRMSPLQSADAGSQFGCGNSQIGGQAPAQPLGVHQVREYYAGLANRPYDPEPHSAGMAYQYFDEEQCSVVNSQYAPTDVPSAVSGPAIRGGLRPDDSVSQYSGHSRYSGPSGQSGYPGYSGHSRNRDMTGSSGGFQFSWVKAESGSKQYLHRGHRHRP